ncbi:MAG: Ig-like domain-containing protein, partial [Aurantibacter sp.]
GVSDSATVSIIVKEPSNNNPIAVDDSDSTEVDSLLTVDPDGVLSNDSDPDGDEISILAYDTTSNAGGTVLLNPDGGFNYTPPDEFEGNDLFSYIITDGRGGIDTAQVNISVIKNATDPVANDDVYSTNKNTVLVIEAPGVLANDTDPNGDPLAVVDFDQMGTLGGSVQMNPDGSFTFTPATDSIDTDTFSYVVSDGNGNTDTAIVSIQIILVVGMENNPPIAENDTLMIDQDLTLEITDPAEGVLANDSDPDGDNITAQVVTNAITDQGGSISINEDGTISYTPATGFVGEDTYEYTICDDGEPELCDTATIVIEVKELPVKVFNAFSPNGDGRNDFWVIQGITRFPNNKVQIFNRWGNLVFKVNGYDNTANVWQGQSTEGLVFGKNEVPDGGYFYVIDLGDGSRRLSGYVVIQR